MNKFEQLWRDYLHTQDLYNQAEDAQEQTTLYQELKALELKVNQELERQDTKRFRRLNNERF